MLPLKLSNLVIVHFFRFDAVSIKLCFLLWEIFLWWFLGVPLASMAKEDDGEDNGEDVEMGRVAAIRRKPVGSLEPEPESGVRRSLCLA